MCWDRDIDITLDESTTPGISILHWTSPRALGGLGVLGAGLAIQADTQRKVLIFYWFSIVFVLCMPRHDILTVGLQRHVGFIYRA